MKKPISLILIGYLSLSACTEMPPTAETSLGFNPVVDGGSYSTGGGLTLAGEIQNVRGMTAVCGAWADGDNQSILSLGKSSRVMSTGAAFLDGQAIHRGLQFMNKVDPMETYAGAPANCVVTSRPWRDGDQARDVQFRLPRQVVHVEVSEYTRVEVLFRQTGPGA